jgi:hypothetical protein
MKVKPPLDDYGSPSPPPTAEIEAMYLWGVFADLSGSGFYVNRYFNEMGYPSMVKGGFKTKEEAEKVLSGMK